MTSPIGLNRAQDRFEKNFRDLIALIEGGAPVMWKKMAAEFILHPDLNDDVDKAVEVWQKSSSEGRMGPYAAVVDARYIGLCHIFYRLMHRNAFTFAEATDEAVEQIHKLEETIGIREPAPPPPPPKSQQDILDEQVINDYGTLDSAKFRAKVSGNRAYAEAFERLSESGQIHSRVTTLHDGYQPGDVRG